MLVLSKKFIFHLMHFTILPGTVLFMSFMRKVFLMLEPNRFKIISFELI